MPVIIGGWQARVGRCIGQGGGRQLIGSQRTQVWRAGVPTLSMGRRRLHAEQPPPPHSSRQRPVASSPSNYNYHQRRVVCHPYACHYDFISASCTFLDQLWGCPCSFQTCTVTAPSPTSSPYNTRMSCFFRFVQKLNVLFKNTLVLFDCIPVGFFCFVQCVFHSILGIFKECIN